MWPPVLQATASLIKLLNRVNNLSTEIDDKRIGENETVNTGKAEPTRVPVREMLKILRPQRRILILAGVLGLVASLIALVQPLLVQRLVDGVDSGGLSSVVYAGVAVLIVAVLAEALIGAFQSWLLGRAGENFVSALRESVVRRVFRLPMSAYGRYRSGDLLSRITADTAAVRSALSNSLIEMSSGVVTLVGALIIMLILEPMLTFVTVGCVVVAGFLVAAVSVRVMVASIAAQRKLGELGAGVERALRNPKTVKLNQAEGIEEQRAASSIDEVRKYGYSLAKYEALIQPITSIAIQGAMVIVISLGGLRVSQGQMTIGDLMAFILYLVYIAIPVGAIFMSVTEIQAGRAALYRVVEVTNEEIETVEGDISQGEPSIEFNDVSFSYPTGQQVLHGASFRCPAHRVTAIVGPSGSGKSTTLGLMAGLYSATSGTVHISNQDVLTVSRESLRSRVAYVEQEFPVLSGTLRENLTYGARAPISDSTLGAIVADVRLDDVAETPDGVLGTDVGESGSKLSGGQRQRLALARAVLRNPDVLLLDEITSQVDALNEESMVDLVYKMAKSKTIVLVAHRLSTVRQADQVILLDEGQVVDHGTHDELLARCSLYRHMVQTQSLE